MVRVRADSFARSCVTPDPWLRPGPEDPNVLSDLRSSPAPLTTIGSDDDVALTVTVSFEGANLVAHLVGELDIATRNIVFQACLAESHLAVEIDMADLGFMDCGGYGGIVAARLVLQERGGSLTLRNQTGQPAHLLGLLSSSDPPEGPTADDHESGLGNESNGRLASSGSHAQPDYRYWLTDDRDDLPFEASTATRKGAETAPRPHQPRRDESIRRVSTIRHSVDH